MMNILVTRKQQNGNVLFLILIAVALFAALSYAVTQSSRSGGDANREQSLLNSAQITQYPTSIKTAALRMMIDGMSVDKIFYTPPANFGTSSDQYIFHPTGGGAVYQEVPSNLMAVAKPGLWIVNAEMFIPEIGTANADMIAYLPGISLDLCRKINNELGLFPSATPPGTPTAFAADQKAVYSKSMSDYDTRGTTGAGAGTITVDNLINDASPVTFHANYAGKSFGCFQNGGGSGEYVYYHVIVER